MTDKKLSAIRGTSPAATLNGQELVELTQGGSTVAATVNDVKAFVWNRGAVVPNVPWFAPSSVTVVAPTSGQPAGDPFIVWDESAELFRMFYFRTPSGVAIYSKTAPTLEGPWSTEATVTGLTNYHKFVVLVDAYGVPVQIGGSFHGYAVYYDGTNLSSKTIYHFTASTLGGTWTVASNVIAKGATGSWDGFANDACYALYDGSTVCIWYMAESDTSQVDCGYGSRIMLATSSDPDSGFTKDYTTAALLPGSSGDWDDGWLGGVQVRKLSDADPYVMFYNAGDTAPSSAGAEPNTSRIGYAYSDSLSGPWVKCSSNPILTLSNLPSTALENTDLWRSHAAYDPAMGRWALFYNTGSAGSGGELVTFARADVYGYQYYPAGGGQIITLTTTEQKVTNSAVNVQPGVYRVRAQLNLIGDASGTLPKLDITTSIRTGGSTHVQDQVDFIGSYAYENRDSICECIVAVKASTTIDMAVKVTAGTPVAATYGRNLRLTVSRLR